MSSPYSILSIDRKLSRKSTKTTEADYNIHKAGKTSTFPYLVKWSL